MVAEPNERPSGFQRAIAAIACAVLAVAALAVELFALYATGGCDDGCPIGDPDDDWQRDLQLWPATAGLLLILSATWLAAAGRMRAAARCAAASALTYVGWLVLVSV